MHFKVHKLSLSGPIFQYNHSQTVTPLTRPALGENNVTAVSRRSSLFLTLCLLVCSLLITFANSLDPDQARRNVGPGLDPNCSTL